MADARVIPLEGGRDDARPARRRTTARGADAVAAGAARAGGERERRRRRTTPLLDTATPPTSAPTKRAASSARTTKAPSAPAERSPARRTPARSAPTSDRLPREVEDAAAQLAADLPDHPSQVPPGEVEERIAAALAFVRRRLTGEYEVDEFGFDAHLTDTVILGLLRPLYRKWFRVEVRGVENVPAEGGALIVANHSGTVAFDSLMTQVAVHDEHPARRHLRMLGADIVFSAPVLGDLARKGGATLAANADAERLLSGGHLVGVWPEGFKGIGKPFSERYKLQRFGRGGFVSAALRTGTPIVPCSIVGAEEIYPVIGSMPTVARLLGVPYFPVTPTFPWLGPLGAVPLPTKWLIEFSEPIPTDDLGDRASASDDPMLVFDLTDRVRETIQQTLYSLLVQRRSVFF